MGWAGNYQPGQQVCVLVGNPAQWTDATVVAVMDSVTSQLVSVRVAGGSVYLIGTPAQITPGRCPQAAPSPGVKVEIGNQTFTATVTRAFQNGKIELELAGGLGTVRIDLTRIDEIG